MLPEGSFLNGSDINESSCISAHKALRGLLLQRRTGQRVRPNFAYEVWRFTLDYSFGLVNSHRHLTEKTKKFGLGSQIWFSSTGTYTGLLVKREVCWAVWSSGDKKSPLNKSFLLNTKEFFNYLLCWLRCFLAIVITIYHTVLHGLPEVPKQSTHYSCENTYTKTLTKPEEFTVLNNFH